MGFGSVSQNARRACQPYRNYPVYLQSSFLAEYALLLGILDSGLHAVLAYGKKRLLAVICGKRDPSVS